MKFKSFLLGHKTLLKDVAVSTCLVGATAGIVFGVSAATFKIEYMDLTNSEKRLAAALSSDNYYNQDITSAWNMNETVNPDGTITQAMDAPDFQSWTDSQIHSTDEKKRVWEKIHGAPNGSFDNYRHLWEKAGAMELTTPEGSKISDNAIKARYNYSAMIIDGASHTNLDRSFNQSLYTGIIDFIKNHNVENVESETLNDPIKHNVAHAYRPAQDNTAEYMNIYLSSIFMHDVLCLAGFNHATPLSELMVHEPAGGNKLQAFATNPTAETNKMLNETAFILEDSNDPNNQNVASVQFRADQPAFLTAVATCQYFYNNLDMYHSKGEPLSVGMFGGVAIPTVTIYMGGFQRGIEFFNHYILEDRIIDMGSRYYFNMEPPPTENDPDLIWFQKLIDHSKYNSELKELSLDDDGYITFNNEYKEKILNEFGIKVISLGKSANHFTGTFVAGDAIGVTKQFLNRGASAIIAVAGPQSLDAAQEIANQGSKCIVIGVDTAMEESDYQRYHIGCDESTKRKPNLNDKYMDQTKADDGSVSEQANAIIKFSAVKDMRSVTKKINRLCAEGLNWDVSSTEEGVTPNTMPDPYRAICGPGFQTCGNIMNGLISISWNGFYPLLQALQHVEFHEEGTIKVSFAEAWAKSAAEYFSELSDIELKALGKEYTGLNPTNPTVIDGVKDITKLMTFRKTDDSGNETPFFKNYASTTAILGRLLRLSHVQFPDGMTVIYDKQTKKPHLPSYAVPFTILEWLDNNMYMQS